MQVHLTKRSDDSDNFEIVIKSAPDTGGLEIVYHPNADKAFIEALAEVVKNQPEQLL